MPVCNYPGNVVRSAKFSGLSRALDKDLVMSEQEESSRESEIAARVRPLVNEILDRFNQENVTPPEAGMVVLALISRLLAVLEDQPESRRYFILTLINVINNYLVEESGEAPSSCPGGPCAPD